MRKDWKNINFTHHLWSITKSYIDISTNVNIGTPIIEIIRDGKKEVELNINNKDRKLISVGNLVTLTDDNEFEYIASLVELAIL